MRLLYNLLFTVFFLLSAPFYFLKMWRRGSWQAGFWQRFGFYSPAIREQLRGDQPVIWMHAVSVGEVNICVPLQQELSKRLPGCRWVVSTTTSTGMGELQKKLPDDVCKIYYPVDLFWPVARAWRAIRPTAVILMEAEIWPNFLWRAMDAAVPVILVNARLSDRSHRGYRRFRFFFEPIMRSIALVAAQSETDRKRWQEVGCLAERVTCTGNLKFDIDAGNDAPRLDVEALLAQAGMPKRGPVIVAGSTHAGEEAILGRIFRRLRSETSGLMLIVVPRHMERAAAVERDLLAVGVACFRRSQIGKSARAPEDCGCLLVDSTGELIEFYRVADLVFVGKSLTGRGGQNPIEPAAQGKPVLVGPHMENFRDVVELLKESGGMLQVTDERQLEAKIREWTQDLGGFKVGARAGKKIVQQNAGSVKRVASAFVMLLNDTPR